MSTANSCRDWGFTQESLLSSSMGPGTVDIKKMQIISEAELTCKIKEDIPALSTIVARILNIVLDDRSSIRDLSEAVRVDQALAAKVLRVVNSAAYGLRGKISTLDQAMVILGFDTLKKLLLCLSIFDNLSQENQEGYLFQKSQFWCHSLAVATVAKGIALLIKYPCPDEAYVAGLMHDVGKIIIEQIMAKEYLNYMRNLNVNPDMSLRFEEEKLSVNHASVGKLAFEKWNLPLTLQKAVELHHGTSGCATDRESNHEKMNEHEEMNELAAIVSVADFICWTQGLGSFNFCFHPTLNSHAEKIVDLKNLKIEPILKEINKELVQNGKIFNLQASDLKGFRTTLQKTNLELGRINSLYSDTKKKLERHIKELNDTKKKLENHVHELNILNDIIYKTRETLKPAQIIQNVLQGLGENFGFPRLIWFSIDPQKKRITPKASYGDFQGNPPINAAGCIWNEEIGILSSACIQNKKILHIKHDHLKHCPDRSAFGSFLLEALQSRELLLVPISTDRSITDLLLIDNQDGTITISLDTVKVLDILALNLGMALENAELFQYVSQMAVIDFLTNVYNRRQLDSSLNNEINRAARFQESFSIVLFDIDHFKTVNDTYGHQVGDMILKDVATIIKSNSRSIDIVGRFGGDEFLAILPNTQMESALTFAERVRLIVEEYGLLRQNIFPKCQVTLSIGVAEFNYSLDTLNMLLQRADKALYQSKQKGKNRVCTFFGED
ncbi:MAG TPA: diguanylate cyclase [Desulfatiglandales bacterium]|nr:diguanylate cyclase [Desulfatiglandales bacterium]